MSESAVVTGCPRCGAAGKVHKTIHEDNWMPRTYIGVDNFKTCPMCEGSGIVFVVPAIVIGPAPKERGAG